MYPNASQVRPPFGLDAPKLLCENINDPSGHSRKYMPNALYQYTVHPLQMGLAKIYATLLPVLSKSAGYDPTLENYSYRNLEQ